MSELETVRRRFQLTAEACDEISDLIIAFCDGAGVDPNDTLRYRLSAEDCLMHWMERGFEGHDVVLQTGTRFGIPLMMLEAEGPRDDPNAVENEDFGAYCGSVLVSLNLKPEFSYADGVNRMTFRLKQADEVAAFVERFLERENCPQEIRKEIEMAAEEIYVNIAGYAYAPGTGPAVIRIEMQEEPRGAAITFTDRGKPFNPLEKEDPDLSLSVKERPVGGLGIYMARNCMDDVAYEYADGQNILKLFRKF